MTKRKSTKRALLLSALSLLLCVSMLIGSTFAWFTDSVTSGSNVIQAGTLDIVMEYWDGTQWVDAEGKILEFKKASTSAGTEVLWEPGCTYELPKIRVRNEGNLAAKIILRLNGVTGDEKLMEAIELQTAISNMPASVLNGSYGAQLGKFNNATVPMMYGTPDGTIIFDWSLMGKGIVSPNSGHTDTSPEFTISGHMKEEAGNEYQGLNIDGVSITALAAQQVYEYDSFGREYDKNAVYAQTAKNFEELRTAVENGGNIVLANDIELTAQLTVKKDVTIDLNGYDLPAKMTESLDQVYDTLIRIENGATMSIYGNGDVNIVDGVGRWIRCVYGSTLNIYGGNWVQHSDDFDASKDPKYCEGIYANEKANVNIYGGTFDFDTVPQYTLNESRGGQIVVYGGTFINFNPTKSGAGDGSYVAEGYKVVSETQANGDIWYTVVAE